VDDLWLGVKGQSNSEIAEIAKSIEVERCVLTWGVEHWMGKDGKGKQFLPNPTKL